MVPAVIDRHLWEFLYKLPIMIILNYIVIILEPRKNILDLMTQRRSHGFHFRLNRGRLLNHTFFNRLNRIDPPGNNMDSLRYFLDMKWRPKVTKELA